MKFQVAIPPAKNVCFWSKIILLFQKHNFTARASHITIKQMTQTILPTIYVWKGQLISFCSLSLTCKIAHQNINLEQSSMNYAKVQPDSLAVVDINHRKKWPTTRANKKKSTKWPVHPLMATPILQKKSNSSLSGTLTNCFHLCTHSKATLNYHNQTCDTEIHTYFHEWCSHMNIFSVIYIHTHTAIFL